MAKGTGSIASRRRGHNVMTVILVTGLLGQLLDALRALGGSRQQE
jgi:hypothetical protein